MTNQMKAWLADQFRCGQCGDRLLLEEITGHLHAEGRQPPWEAALDRIAALERALRQLDADWTAWDDYTEAEAAAQPQPSGALREALERLLAASDPRPDQISTNWLIGPGNEFTEAREQARAALAAAPAEGLDVEVLARDELAAACCFLLEHQTHDEAVAHYGKRPGCQYRAWTRGESAHHRGDFVEFLHEIPDGARHLREFDDAKRPVAIAHWWVVEGGRA